MALTNYGPLTFGSSGPVLLIMAYGLQMGIRIRNRTACICTRTSTKTRRERSCPYFWNLNAKSDSLLLMPGTCSGVPKDRCSSLLSSALSGEPPLFPAVSRKSRRMVAWRVAAQHFWAEGLVLSPAAPRTFLKWCSIALSLTRH